MSLQPSVGRVHRRAGSLHSITCRGDGGSERKALPVAVVGPRALDPSQGCTIQDRADEALPACGRLACRGRGGPRRRRRRWRRWRGHEGGRIGQRRALARRRMKSSGGLCLVGGGGGHLVTRPGLKQHLRFVLGLAAPPLAPGAADSRRTTPEAATTLAPASRGHRLVEAAAVGTRIIAGDRSR